VGTAEWTGVPLATLLDRAGLGGSAHEVVLEGADRGVAVEKPSPADSISFARSVGVDKALDDVLIAYAMNGVEIPQHHGFPVRAIRAGPLRCGVDQMAHAHPGDRGAVSGLLADGRLRILGREPGFPVRRPFVADEAEVQIARPRTMEVIREHSRIRCTAPHGADGGRP